MSYQGSNLADSVLPPKDVWVQAVDATSRSYNLTALTINGAPFQPNAYGRVWMTIVADGGDIYFAVDSASRTIVPASAVAAGGTPAYLADYCELIKDGTRWDVELIQTVHQYLMLITASGTSKARIHFSSETTQQSRGS